MEAIEKVQKLAGSWWNFFDYCFNHDPGASLCQAFWGKTIVACIGLGAVLVAYGVWKYVAYRRQYAAAIRAQWLREQSDEVGIQEERWIADSAYQADIPEDELLARIRAGVAARQREVGPPPVEGPG